MSTFQTKFGALRQKARDKLAPKKASILAPEDQKVEDELLGLRDAYQAVQRRLGEAHHADEKKTALVGLGNKLMKAGQSLDGTTAFGTLLTKVGRLERDLGMLQVQHQQVVMTQTHAPLTQLLAKDFPELMQYRRRLLTANTELENVKAKYQAACSKGHKAGVTAPAGKLESMRDDMEAAERAFLSAQSTYVEQLQAVSARSGELVDPLLRLAEEQLQAHQTACRLIEAVLPDLRKIQDSSGHRGVFGQPLPDKGVAAVLPCLAAVIVRDGLDAEGIFRRAGAKTTIRRLRASLNNGSARLDDRESYNGDIYAVGALIKIYLRELPDCLLQSELYDGWMAAAAVEEHEDRLTAMKVLVDKLPKGNYDTLAFLCRFFAIVCSKSEINKMTENNMGIVIGPNLLRDAEQDPSDPATFSASDTGLQGTLGELLIRYHEWLFPPSPEDPPLDPANANPESVPGYQSLAQPKRVTSWTMQTVALPSGGVAGGDDMANNPVAVGVAQLQNQTDFYSDDDESSADDEDDDDDDGHDNREIQQDLTKPVAGTAISAQQASTWKGSGPPRPPGPAAPPRRKNSKQVGMTEYGSPISKPKPPSPPAHVLANRRAPAKPAPPRVRSQELSQDSSDSPPAPPAVPSKPSSLQAANSAQRYSGSDQKGPPPPVPGHKPKLADKPPLPPSKPKPKLSD